MSIILPHSLLGKRQREPERSPCQPLSQQHLAGTCPYLSISSPQLLCPAWSLGPARLRPLLTGEPSDRLSSSHLGPSRRPLVFLLTDALLSPLAISYHLPPSPGLNQGSPRAELLPAPPRATCPCLRPSLLSLPRPAPIALIGLAGPRKPTSQPEKPQPSRLGLLRSPTESTEATVALPNP